MGNSSALVTFDWATRINLIGEVDLTNRQEIEDKLKELRGQIRHALSEREHLRKDPAVQRLLKREARISQEIQRREEALARRRSQLRTRVFGASAQKMLTNLQPEGVARLQAELYVTHRQITKKLSEKIDSLVVRTSRLEDKLLQDTGNLNQIDLAELEKQTHIARRHIESIRGFTSANNGVIIYRGVNPGATPLLQTGEYKGKDVFFKGKSSNFRAILAELPLDARLSKLAQIKDPIRREYEIARYQQKVDAALVDYDRQYLELFGVVRGEALTGISQEVIDKANMALLAVAEGKTDAQGRQIYVAKNKQGLNWEVGTEPVFFVNAGGKYLAYNTTSEAYDRVIKLPEGYTPSAVRVPKYCSYALDAQGSVIENRHPITADYDALVIAMGRVFPFDSNDGWDIPGLSVEEFRRLEKEYEDLIEQVPNSPRLAEIENLVMSALRPYEIQRFRNDHFARDYRALAEQEKLAHAEVLKYDKFLGIVTEMESAVQGFLRAETDGATSHGAEVRNPFPEPFGEETYTVFLPTGRVKIINSPQDVCDYINALRLEGYAMPVNPRWGWKTDGEGKLYIPEQRFDWQAIDESIAELASRIKTLQADIAAPSAGQDIEQMRQDLQRLQDMHQAQQAMRDLKLAIVELQTASHLHYTQTTMPSTLAQKAMALLRRAELDDRQALLQDKTKLLDKMMDDYSLTFDEIAPIRYREADLASQVTQTALAQPTADISLNSTKPTPMPSMVV